MPLYYHYFNEPSICDAFDNSHVQYISDTLHIIRSVVKLQFIHCTKYAKYAFLLLLSIIVHPNPGPFSASSSNSSLNTTNMSSSFLSSLNFFGHLSFVHYNVQSTVPKLDLLSTELFDFDILSFSETWLTPSVSSNDLHIQYFNKPKRKDRVGDSHGCVLIYVEDTIQFDIYISTEPLHLRCGSYLHEQIDLRHTHIGAI